MRPLRDLKPSAMLKLPRAYYGLIAKLLDKKIPGTGLAVFRIVYSLILMCEVGHLIYYRHLIFDPLPYLQPYELGNFSLVLITWELSLLFLMFGAFTRLAAVVNYMLTLVFFSGLTSFEYHIFYMYCGTNFLLIFLDVSRCLSFDSLARKLKHYSFPDEAEECSANVSQLHYLCVPFFVLGFTYFDSVFHKLDSEIWRTGLGLWMPTTIPQTVHFDASPLLNIRWLSITLGYTALIFEAVFIFIFWNRYARLPLLIIGLGMHAGIVVHFPIPWFGLAVMAMYITMVPVGFWAWLKKCIIYPQPKLTVVVDEHEAFTMRAVIVLRAFDVRQKIAFESRSADRSPTRELPLDDVPQSTFSVDNKGVIRTEFETYEAVCKQIFFFVPYKLIRSLLRPLLARTDIRDIAPPSTCTACETYSCKNKSKRDINQVRHTDHTQPHSGIQLFGLNVYSWGTFFLIISLLQVNVTLNSPVARRVLRMSNLDKLTYFHSPKLEILSRKMLGITRHTVFLDSHFDGYNKIIALEWQDPKGHREWLPIIDKLGMPCGYNYGTNWANWSFRTNHPKLDMNRFHESLPKWLLFWSHKNEIKLTDGHFNIYLKKIDLPTTWQRNFLKQQFAKPWEKIETATWQESTRKFKFVPTVTNTMQPEQSKMQSKQAKSGDSTP